MMSIQNVDSMTEHLCARLKIKKKKTGQTHIAQLVYEKKKMKSFNMDSS